MYKHIELYNLITFYGPKYMLLYFARKHFLFVFNCCSTKDVILCEKRYNYAYMGNVVSNFYDL